MIEELQELTGEISLNQELTGELDKIVEVIEPVTQEKEITPTKQTQSVQPDEGYTGLSQVTVNPIPPEYIIPALDSKSITANGTYNASDEALDGYSSVSVNIDAFQVNGKIENKVIQSGNVAKGDIVVKGIAEKTDRLSDAADYELYNPSSSSIVWPERLLDNNDTTFGRVTNSTSTAGIYIRCKNRQALGIPTYSKILSITTKYKIAWSYTAQGSTGSGINVVYGKLENGEWSNKKSAGYSKAYPATNSQPAFVDEFEFPNLFLNSFDDTDNYQIRFSATATRYVWIDLYYVKFVITYEDGGVIKTVTNLGETICGIANQNGNQGDTIEVFVPNVE